MEPATTPQQKEQSSTSSEAPKIVTRTATANWQGDLKEGKGKLSTTSGVLKETNYSFKTRFESGEAGTNPEELLAAAHAGCFTMAVAAMLTKKGLKPTALDTTASVQMEGLSITGIRLSITGTIPGITVEDFTLVSREAEKNCMISKIISIPISSEAILVS
jgi:osmotically inducible protein OsmC